MVFSLDLSSVMQAEYMLAKPARDAAAKAKLEAEALVVEEIPLHDDNEWNIRYFYKIINWKHYVLL